MQNFLKPYSEPFETFKNYKRILNIFAIFFTCMQKKDQKNVHPQKPFWFKSKLSPHTTKKLKDGTEKTYYVVSIPIWAIERGELDPSKEYIFECYEVQDETENDKK